jgi:predicted dehydrogenase
MRAPIEAVLVGAGNRGYRTYGRYATEHPGNLRFVAVVELDAGRRERFAEAHGIPQEMQFSTWEELAERPPLALAAVNATMDQVHLPSTLALLEAGYEVLLEKPVATTPQACVALAQAAEQRGRVLQIGHVLRYAPFFRTVYDVVKSGQLGDIISVDWRENLVYWHYAHSFVRGNWRRADTSGPMLLTKCCHDLDLLVWMFGACEQIASFGEQRHFTCASVGPEVPARCLDGCPHATECLYYAPRLYLDRLAEDTNNFTVGAITLEPTREGVLRALAQGPYGRCVYRCDNDVVDHQVVLMRFPNQQAISLTMQGASHVEGRTLRIDGTRGTLLGNEARDELKLMEHGGQQTPVDIPSHYLGPHGGGDAGLLDAFVGILRGEPGDVSTSARESIESHLMAFAGEEARVTGATIAMADYRARITAELEQRQAAPSPY